MFELGKDLFDRVRIGSVFWQEEQLDSSRADELAHGSASVAAEIVQDDDVAGTKGRQENLFDVDPEAHAIDWSLDEPWRIDPVMAQGRQGRSWFSSGHGRLWRGACARAAPIPATAPCRSGSRSRR